MSTDTSAVILIPLSVTDAMMAAGTSIPAVDAAAGEVAWAAGTAYSAGQRVNHGGSIWESVASSTASLPARTAPNGCALGLATAWRRLMTS